MRRSAALSIPVVTVPRSSVGHLEGAVLIIVAGRLYVDPGARDGYLDGCRSVIEQARATTGCLDFVLSADPIDANRINLYERWESEAPLKQFRAGGPEADQLAQLRVGMVMTYLVHSADSL